MEISPERRREIIGALRKGTVPQRGLDFLAVGLQRFDSVIAEELTDVAQAGAIFKAVRGEYGCGKTFFARWVQEYAKKQGFATAEVQISEAETPLHRLETVYRRAMEQLSTPDCFLGAFRSIIDGWFYGLEEDVLAEGGIDPSDEDALASRADELLEQRLVEITRATPQFAAALRSYRTAQRAGNHATAEGLAGWLAGQPHIAASVKREAGIKGDVDHFAALSFLRGLLLILKDSGFSGLVLVLDEIETIQRVRSDVREKGLNALRQLIDDIDGGRFPGLYLVITGTPAFYDGPQGIQRLEPLAQRLHVDFQTDARFDNPRAVQLRLTTFDHDRLVEVGTKVRDLFAADCRAPERIRSMANAEYIDALARSLTGKLGGKVGITPRLFLKKLVGDVLDRIDQFDDFDPREHYQLTVTSNEMTNVEREAQAKSVDDIELDL
ncbi:BREX system ATP-binding protein BrxD [Stieleria mannarensis]|uniref:BREX system ATP-binding protein BrxD n=1 Tax=Stieleria mannarensis TaxID=2755585 RepID=UPI001601ED18|nr:BREX system ATP-binding protein BrxD [Rhodopirellula sp. JC639]